MVRTVRLFMTGQSFLSYYGPCYHIKQALSTKKSRPAKRDGSAVIL